MITLISLEDQSFFSSNIGVCDLKWVVVPSAVSCEFKLGPKHSELSIFWLFIYSLCCYEWAHPFYNLQSRARTHAILAIGLYEFTIIFWKKYGLVDYMGIFFFTFPNTFDIWQYLYDFHQFYLKKTKTTIIIDGPSYFNILVLVYGPTCPRLRAVLPWSEFHLQNTIEMSSYDISPLLYLFFYVYFSTAHW
jgi:hypothetical protein